MGKETDIGGRAREFPATRWTLILSSRDNPEAQGDALEELLGTYWKPLYYYVRRKGLNVEKAKDAIQGFVMHLLEREFLSRLDPKKGKFRGYLRTALDNFLANQYEKQMAQKRGGGSKIVGMDFDIAERNINKVHEDSDVAYEREWAMGVMERSMLRLRDEFEAGMRKGPFEVVLKFFRPTEEVPSYAEAAKDCGMTETQFKAFLHRARARFRRIVREEVSHTVSDPAEIDAEVEELKKALSR